MKKYFSLFQSFLTGSFLLCAISTSAGAASVYAQFSSLQDQYVSAENVNKPIAAKMEKQDSGIGARYLGEGISWSEKAADKVVIKEPGLYFIMVLAQVGSKENAKDFKGANISLWYELNGKTIANSGNWTYAGPAERVKNVLDPLVLPFKAGDTIRIMYSTSNESAGLIAVPANDVQPASPSLTFTIFKIS